MRSNGVPAGLVRIAAMAKPTENPTSPAAKPRGGLVAPVAEFVATGKDGRVAGRLALGNQSGGLLYAIGHRIPGIFQVRPDLLTQIPSRLALLASVPATPP